MGQRQSTGAAAEDEAPAKTDYYELIGVERTATDDEIKRAYRRKALELHPDRNYGNVEETTRLFAEVQSAYEILSDPQERAWYDSHRDVLLRGDQATGADGTEFSYNVRMTTTDDVLKMMMKFSHRLEFNDAPSGFFGGLNDFFNQLAKEEDIACQWENEEGREYPEFGHKDDGYEEVVRPFYAAWTGFATRKSYSWKDEYRLSDAPDRRVRRLMEKENKRIRDDAIQEYNEAVRSVIAFVRKRDPRVKNNQQSEAERQKALREAAAAQAARDRAAQQAKLQNGGDVVPEWAKSRARDEHEGGFSSESEIEEHEYECVVCDKTFKSEAQFKAHEKNKKHLKLLKQLQKEMRDQGVDLNLNSKDPEPEDEVGSDAAGGHTTEPVQAESASTNEFDDEFDDAELAPGQDDATDAPVDATHRDESSDESDDYASRAEVEQRIAGGSTEKTTKAMEGLSLKGTPAASDSEQTAEPKVGKAKQKRARKAAQAAEAAEAASSARFQCQVCKEQFPSSPKLFDHLRKKNHAVPLTQVKGAKSGKGKKR
jgi:DnaJ homolog subfamily A member 5